MKTKLQREFEKLQDRAAQLGMVVGLYLASEDLMPPEGGRRYIEFARRGRLDAPLGDQLVAIDAEIEYWESQA